MPPATAQMVHPLVHVRERGRARGSGVEVDGELWYVIAARDGKVSLWHHYGDRERAAACAGG